jgi:hypothetical protein
MNDNREVTYALDFRAGSKRRRENDIVSSRPPLPDTETGYRAIPRIARLMALAIRFEGMLRDETIQDYAELARLGRVTRARITQIMKLRHLAPDIQEQILFLPNTEAVNERNLRPIVCRIDWCVQRRMFRRMRTKTAMMATLSGQRRSCGEPPRRPPEERSPNGVRTQR